MDRSIILIVLTTLVGSVVLSGCTAQAFPQATAKEVQSPADETAHAWAPDAQLVAIAGLEGRWSGSASMQSSGASYSTGWHGHEERAEADARVGDGRCEFWVFRYVSTSQDAAYEVVVDRDGNVIGSEQDERDPDDDQPIGAYNVNSDQAASKASDINDGIREAESRENGGSVLALDRDDDHDNPVWVILAAAMDDGERIGGIVVLDAVTGDVLADFDFSDWGQWGAWGSYGSGSYSSSTGYGPGGHGGHGGERTGPAPMLDLA